MNAAHRTAAQEAKRMESVYQSQPKPRYLSEEGMANKRYCQDIWAFQPVHRGRMNITDVVRITAQGR